MATSERRKTQITMPTDREIVVTRIFDAPRELVWEMWTEAKHLKHWWGPKGWSLPVCEVDFRPGGEWFYCMQGPDMLSCGKAVYTEIVKPERFGYKDMFVDADGSLLEGMPVAESTARFIERGGATLVTNSTTYATKAERDKVIEMGVEEGIDQTLDRLEAYLETLK